MGAPDSLNHQKNKRLPEDNLLIAIIARAVKDYLSNDPTEFDSAANFLFRTEGGLGILFDMLGWCPDRFRKAVKRHHDEGTHWRSLITEGEDHG